MKDVIGENDGEDEGEAARKPRKCGKYKKMSRTDADASMAPAWRNRPCEPSYKQHAAVDDERGVVLNVAVTTGEVNDGDMIEAQVDSVQEIAGRGITTATGDAGYAYGKVYAGLERRGVDPVIPAKRERRSGMPLRRLRYDAMHDIVKRPQGKILRPQRLYTYGRFYYSKTRVCKHCPINDACLWKRRLNKAIGIGHDSSGAAACPSP